MVHAYGNGDLSITKHCFLSAGAQKYNHYSVNCSTSGGKTQVERTFAHVGDNRYAVPNALSVKGVNITSSCIVGANSLVLGDVPKNIEAFGEPCKLLG